jgi:hypothetical protein
MVAVSLTTLMGFVALSLDGGMLLDQRRKLQSTGDAAALAAAGKLYYNSSYDLGYDPAGTAKQAALDTASANGYQNGVNCTVTVNIPPQSGTFKNVPGHVEVLISYDQPRFFSRLLGSGNIPVGSRAVARGRNYSFKDAILVLNPTGKGSLNAGGGGTITVSGSPIQINSTSSEAAIANGNGSIVAPEFDVTGGTSTPGGGSFTGTILSGAAPIPDPYQFLPVPDPTTMTIQSSNKTTINGGNTVNLQPGVYKGGITISGKGNVNLAPGIYYMDGGGFNWGGQGNLTGTGVMIYNAPTSTSDKIDLSGQGTCTLSAPTNGPYQGFTLFQDRTSTVPVNVTGQGAMSITGSFYAAAATLKITGNGTTDVIGGQYVAYDLITGGNGSFGVKWKATETPNVRQLHLVE